MRLRKRNIITEVIQLMLLEGISNEDLFNKFYSNKGMSQEDFEKIIQVGPDKRPDGTAGPLTKIMLDWYVQDKFSWAEITKISQTLRLYNRKKNFIPIKDLKQLKNITYFLKVMDRFIDDDYNEAFMSNKEREDFYKGKADVPYEDESWKVVVPKNKSASQIYGKGTQWCTAALSNNKFDDYNGRGPLYICINKEDGSKYQFHPADGEAKEETNKNIVEPYHETIGATHGLSEYLQDQGVEMYHDEYDEDDDYNEDYDDDDVNDSLKDFYVKNGKTYFFAGPNKPHIEIDGEFEVSGLPYVRDVYRLKSGDDYFIFKNFIDGYVSENYVFERIPKSLYDAVNLENQFRSREWLIYFTPEDVNKTNGLCYYLGKDNGSGERFKSVTQVCGKDVFSRNISRIYDNKENIYRDNKSKEILCQAHGSQGLLSGKNDYRWAYTEDLHFSLKDNSDLIIASYLSRDNTTIKGVKKIIFVNLGYDSLYMVTTDSNTYKISLKLNRIDNKSLNVRTLISELGSDIGENFNVDETSTFLRLSNNKTYNLTTGSVLNGRANVVPNTGSMVYTIGKMGYRLKNNKEIGFNPISLGNDSYYVVTSEGLVFLLGDTIIKGDFSKPLVFNYTKYKSLFDFSDEYDDDDVDWSMDSDEYDDDDASDMNESSKIMGYTNTANRCYVYNFKIGELRYFDYPGLLKDHGVVFSKKHNRFILTTSDDVHYYEFDLDNEQLIGEDGDVIKLQDVYNEDGKLKDFN